MSEFSAATAIASARRPSLRKPAGAVVQHVVNKIAHFCKISVSNLVRKCSAKERVSPDVERKIAGVW
jgi:hypothetical protein